MRSRGSVNAAFAVALALVLIVWLVVIYAAEAPPAAARAQRQPPRALHDFCASIQTGDLVLARGAGWASDFQCAALRSPVTHCAIAVVVESAPPPLELHAPRARALQDAERAVGRTVLLWESGVSVGARFRTLSDYIEHGGVSVLAWRATRLDRARVLRVIQSRALTHYGYSFRFGRELLHRVLHVPLMASDWGIDSGVYEAQKNCSDLVAHVYAELGALHTSVRERNVFPADYLGDAELPWLDPPAPLQFAGLH